MRIEIVHFLGRTMSDPEICAGNGPIGAKLMILGEAPSYEETAAR